MQEIYYNSWLSYYKSPFGAVTLDTVLTLTVRAPKNASVSLLIHTDNNNYGKESYPMNEFEPGSYRFSPTLKHGIGLYFYYFEITEKSENGYRTYYYGARYGRGGVGRLYANEAEVSKYQLTCYKEADLAPSWYVNGAGYQIFPDRFFNGNTPKMVNAPKPNTFLYGRETDEPLYFKDAAGDIVRWDFYGGNLAGIRAKIPYLKELEVTFLYLNPIFEAQSNHRYDTADYLAIDSVLGTEEDFVALLAELHDNGMRIILDGVFSHVGQNSRYFNRDGQYGKQTGAYRDPNSPYASWFTFDTYPDGYKSWWGIKDLPEVRKEQVSFQEFIYGDLDSVLAKWNELGVDGWRLDVADELPDTFIAGIRHNLDSYPEKVLIGEVWEDASNKISYDKRRQYILGDGLQGVMNYPFRHYVIELLTKQKTPEKVATDFLVIKENYPPDVLLNNLNNLGTHDTERIFTMLGENVATTELACALLFMLPGVPCVYYGDERGVTGGKDPQNRKFFPWAQAPGKLFTAYQTWMQRRTESAVLQRGGFYPFYTENFFGICRYLAGSYQVYLLNLGETSVPVEIDRLIFPGECPLSYEELAPHFVNKILQPGESYYFAKEVVKRS